MRAARALALALAGSCGALWAPGCLFTLEPPLEPLTIDAGYAGAAGTTSDATVPETAPIDAPLEGDCSDGDAAQCQANAKRCSGSTPQLCVAGQWVDQPACSTAAPCDQGQCVSQSPSCIGLPATCGPLGKETCCAAPMVPGGDFLRSYDGVSYADASFPASVADFRLDQYEVTVGRFRKFVEAWPSSKPSAGVGKHPLAAGTGWDSAWDAALPGDQAALKAALLCDAKFAVWSDTPGLNESRPINCVTWYEAFAFCAWDGGRLPTEAEWNYAASGGAQQRAYPWSEPPSSTLIDDKHASYYLDDSKMCMGDGNIGCSVGDLVVPGSKPLGAGRWGHAELAGNLMEWVWDWHADNYPMPCNNCANAVAQDADRVMRGGEFDLKAASALTSFRFRAQPGWRRNGYGIRCARAAN